MFFFSSPPQPPPIQPQFYTTPFTFTHTPSTPSPLRTSHYANTLRRPQHRMSDTKPATSAPSSSSQTLSSPIKPASTFWPETDSENTPSAFTFSPVPTSTSSNDTPIFTPRPTTTTPATSRTALRNRASTPTAQLASHAHTRAATTKRNIQTRIRNQRDERFGRDEKVLRADWVDERRRWEEEMRRLAEREAGVGGGDEEEDDAEGMEGLEKGEDGKEGMSPVEEREIEALVELMEEQERETEARGDGDSQDWDDVFMEVLSQEVAGTGSVQDVSRAPEEIIDGAGDVEMS